MVTGTHVLLYTSDPDADRAFFRDVLQFTPVDAGHGWLIFGLPPAEVAMHPGDGQFVQRHGEQTMAGAVLYLMCDDITRTIADLQARGATCTPPVQQQWGIVTSLRLPSGTDIGLYQPAHPTANR